MKIIKGNAKCAGCTACMGICPVGAISMREGQDGFLYPYVDNQKCINCGKCISVCPMNGTVKSSEAPEVYALISRDLKKRMHSSSGGGGYVLAKKFLEQGSVYAAVYTDNWDVIHTKIENKKQLWGMMGSKYVQSDLGNAFKLISQEIVDKRKVLFIGTPCQVAGLKSLVGDNDNLMTIDVVCHGVPTKKIWREYLDSLKAQYGSEITSINQRAKNLKGWHNYNTRICFANGAKYERIKDKDAYMCLFLNDYILRDSCFECKYRRLDRVSDITLGDFWGIESIKSSLNDDMGTSLVLVNTNKGKALFDSIKESCEYECHDLQEVMQAALVTKLTPPKNRKKFWELYYRKGYGKAAKRYGKRTLKAKVLYNALLPIVRRLGVYHRLIAVYGHMKFRIK